MTDGYITDWPTSDRFPHYTRANAGEVMGDPVSPLGWTFGWEGAMVLGLRDANVAKAWTEGMLAKGFIIPGFGHRIYNQEDPKADLIRKFLPEFAKTDEQKLLLEVSRAIEETASAYLNPKGIYVNIHFYTAILIRENIGDMMWYAAMICNFFGWDFSKVLDENVVKLKERYGDIGFNYGSVDREMIKWSEVDSGKED